MLLAVPADTERTTTSPLTPSTALGDAPAPEHTGLYHFALLYPNRRELAKAVKRVLDHGHTSSGTHDDGASESVFLRDPDGNGLELYCDRPREQWTDERGRPYFTRPRRFDLADLLEEL